MKASQENVIKVLYVWPDIDHAGFDVLVRTGNGLCLVQFRDYETEPTRLFCENEPPKELVARLAFATEIYKQMLQTDVALLRYRESYSGRYYTKCTNGWTASIKHRLFDPADSAAATLMTAIKRKHASS